MFPVLVFYSQKPYNTLEGCTIYQEVTYSFFSHDSNPMFIRFPWCPVIFLNNNNNFNKLSNSEVYRASWWAKCPLGAAFYVDANGPVTIHSLHSSYDRVISSGTRGSRTPTRTFVNVVDINSKTSFALRRRLSFAPSFPMQRNTRIQRTAYYTTCVRKNVARSVTTKNITHSVIAGDNKEFLSMVITRVV